MTEALTVTVERDFTHAPDKLWRALTQPHLMAEWLMKNDFAPEIGHRFHMTGDWGGTLDCEVLEIEPGEMLSYRWDFVNEDPTFDLRSVVTFTLTPTSGGTNLKVEQTGFRPDQQRAFGGAQWGWNQNFDKLGQMLATD